MSERLVAYAPNGGRLGVLPWPLSWSVTIPHGELGAASLTYSRKTVGGSLLGRRLTDGLELALEVWTGTAWVEPAGGRFLALERRFDPSDATDTVDITAPAYGWLLSKIRHAAPSEAMYATDGDNKGRRQFIGVTAGVVLKTLRDEYVARGGWAIELGFTTATDSRGNPWPPLNAFWVSRGEALDVTVGRLADGGAVETWWEGRTLHAAPPAAGRELGNEVILRAGREIAEAASTETISDLISAHTLHGGDGLMVTSTEPSAPTPWGRWEGFASDDRVTVPASATARNQSILAASARMRGQYTRDLTPLASALLGVDVLPGDWIAATTAERTPERVRVASLLWRADAQGVTRSLILNDSLLDAELRRQRRARLGDDVGANGAGTTVRPVPEGADKRTPAKVAGLIVTSDAYIDPEGSAQALLSASWAEVSTARPEDGGGALEVAGYDLAVRRNVVGAPWQVVLSTEALWAEHGPLPVGEAYQVRVRARGRYATAPGLWSDPVTLTMAVDTTPPPVPSVPVLSSSHGVVTIAWDGLTGEGAGQPRDFSHVAVFAGETSSPTTVVDTLTGPGQVHVPSTSGATIYVRFKAVDRSGNESAFTSQRQIVVRGVLDDTSYAEDMAALEDAMDARDAMIAAIQDDVDEARADATTALISANGRNSRIVSTGSPSGVTNPRTGQPWVEGDTWWKWDSTATRNVIGAWAYRNGEWVAEMIGGVIIKDGSVTAEKVAADLAMANRFAGLMATFGEAFIGKVKADYVDSGVFTGKVFTGGTFTGSTFRTASYGARVQMDSNGLRAYNASGATTFNLSGSTGSFNGFSITGTTISGGTITGGTITGTDIMGNTITGGTISGATVTGGTLTGAVIRSSVSGRRIEIDNENTGGRLRYLDSAGDSRVAMEVNAGGGYLSFYTTTGREALKVSQADGLTIDSSKIVMNSNQLVGDWTSQVHLAAPVLTLRCSDYRLGFASGGLFWKLRYAQAGTASAPVYAAIWEYQGGPSRMPPITGGFPLAMSANSDGGGTVCVTTSSRRAKADIRDIEVDPYRILDVRPRDWLDRVALEADPTLTTRTPGVVAEEVEDAGLSEFVTYHNDQVQGVMYDRLPVLFIPIIKDLIKRIETLEGTRNG